MAQLCVCCTLDKSIHPLSQEESKQFQSFLSLQFPHQLTIADETEPGERLLLCLEIKDAISQQPMSQHFTFFYHVNAKGVEELTDPNNKTTTRLNGTVLTDRNGMATVSTILPGSSMEKDQLPIHLKVAGADPKIYNVFFTQRTSYLFNFFNKNKNNTIITPLKKTSTGQLTAFATVEVKTDDPIK